MAAKMNWQRTQPGCGGFDERTANEWRNGPEPTESDLTNMPNSRSADLLLPPTIYWSVNLARAFPEADESGHHRLRQAAIRTAAAIYKSHGINSLLARSLALYERSSRSKPFSQRILRSVFRSGSNEDRAPPPLYTRSAAPPKSR